MYAKSRNIPNLGKYFFPFYFNLVSGFLFRSLDETHKYPNMIRIYESRSRQWYESMRFASQYFGCNPETIKALVNKGERTINGRLVDFRDSDTFEDPKQSFINKRGLKHMLENFYLDEGMTVWMWASNKKKWMEWKTIKFHDSGDVAFKTQVINGKLKSDKWVKVNHYYKQLFPERCLTPFLEARL
jgi:hypothetical protein